MTPKESIGAIILSGCLILFLLGVIYWIVDSIDQHFVEYLHGFWAGDTIDGHCVLYLDSDHHMRLIESNDLMETASMKKGKYSLRSKTIIDLNVRKYRLIINDLDSKSTIGQKLNQSNLWLDLYPIEGTCIIYDDSGDILTLAKDHKSNLALMI